MAGSFFLINTTITTSNNENVSCLKSPKSSAPVF